MVVNAYTIRVIVTVNVYVTAIVMCLGLSNKTCILGLLSECVDVCR